MKRKREKEKRRIVLGESNRSGESKSYSSGGGEPPTSSFHPTTALFASFRACVTRYFAYRRHSLSLSLSFCLQGEDLRVARRPHRCHRGHRPPTVDTSVPSRKKNLYRRGRRGSLTTDRNWGRLNFDTSFTLRARSPSLSLCVCSRRRELRGKATVRGYCRTNLRCTRRSRCFQDEKRVPPTLRQTRRFLGVVIFRGISRAPRGEERILVFLGTKFNDLDLALDFRKQSQSQNSILCVT